MSLWGENGLMACLGADSVSSYECYLQITSLGTSYSGTMSLWTWFLDPCAASTALRQASATARHVFCGWIRPGECCILKPAFQCASVEHKPSSLCRLSSFYKGWKNLTLSAIKYSRNREEIVQENKFELVLYGFMEAFYCYAYIPTYIFLITSELVLIYLFSRVIAFRHMENFISGVFAFFFISL